MYTSARTRVLSSTHLTSHQTPILFQTYRPQEYSGREEATHFPGPRMLTASREAMQRSYAQGESAMSCRRQWVFVYLRIGVGFQEEVRLRSGLEAE